MIGPTKPPTIRIKLWMNTQVRPASQPLIESPVLAAIGNMITNVTTNTNRKEHDCGLAEDEKASLIILHGASDLDPWELYSEDLAFIGSGHKIWPLDRVLAEAGLDLTRFLEPSMQSLKSIPLATKRVVLGPVPQQITPIADEEMSI
jgi:hypothetical protein